MRAVPESPLAGELQTDDTKGPAERTPTDPQAITVIEPPAAWEPPRFREIWAYRELLYFFAWRDVKVRYKQTVIGAAWAVLQPIMTMVVFSLIFGGLLGVPSDGVPYPVFTFAALLPWMLFASGITHSSASLVQDANLISKVYFPRLIAPLAAMLPPMLDFGISFLILLVLMAIFGVIPGMAVLTLPLFILLAALTALGVGVWLSALNVKYRDVGYVVPFLTQFWLFLTPVAYPSSIIPEQWKVIYGLNPMAGVIDGFRWALLGMDAFPGPTVIASTVVVVGVLVSGIFYFRRVEAEFADVV